MAHTFVSPDKSGRYELTVDGHVAFANYRNIEGVIEILHTEVPRSLREGGVGSRLVLAMLDDIRAQGLQVRLRCSFARHVVAQHPEYRNLVA